MSDAGERADHLGDRDDIVAPFQLEGRAVRGRVARLGPLIDEILRAHDYPYPVAALTGEAALLALLIGSGMKFEGRLIIQASSKDGVDGPVSFVVADYTVGEGLRAFAKYDAEGVAKLEAEKGRQPGAQTLIGQGLFVMTIDQGSDMQRYQGVTELQDGSLARSAEDYFMQSEQLPTRIRLAVGREMEAGGGQNWRAGGAMIQRLAEDETRPGDDEDFDHARALFDTLTDVELIDREVSAGRLMYRLFHEEGVRIFEAETMVKRCTCERARLARILASFSEDDLDHMIQDGAIVMTCEYCNRDWRFDPNEVEAAGRGPA
ncbi:MAG: Hsp33 family molecular chaperone [Pseudomonadota bacterium]